MESKKLTTYEIVLLPILGVLMFLSKMLMEFLPNIHLLGLFIMAFTLVYRWKALIPIYIYATLLWVYLGFSPWWLPNLYTWSVLWLVTMLLPRQMPTRLASVVYPLVCALHGLSYGVLCAPVQAAFFHLTWEGTVAWVVTGLPFDGVHAVGNFFTGLMIIPLTTLLTSLNKRMQPRRQG